MLSFAGILCLAIRIVVVSPVLGEPYFSTFSIVAVDPATGEAGEITAVTR